MKRSLLFFFLLGCLGIVLQAQSPGPASATIQANNVKAVINSDGTLFNDGQAGQFIPIDPGLAEITLLQGSGLWVVGKDLAGNVKGSVTVNEHTDFMPGALDESGLPYAERLDNIWQVLCTDVDQHLADFYDNGVIDNPNANIFGFPGKNNPSFQSYNNNQPLPQTSQPLAGYYDANDDGSYGPSNGDYPSVELRGCALNQFPQEQAWFVSNDVTEHPSGLSTNQIEIQVQVFAYKTLSLSPLNNPIFVRYKIINRATEPLDSCYFGLFADFDIGNPTDDFMGTIAARNIMYGYNGDNNDEGGFGNNIPVMAVDLMRGPLDTAGYELDIHHMMVLENAENLQPQQYFNLSSGRFADGSLAPNGGIMYPDNPSILNGNSEQAAGHAPGQRMGLAAYGPFKLLPGAYNELVAAYYFVHTPGATPLQNVQQLYDDTDVIQGLFDNCFQNMDRNCDGLLPTMENIPATHLSIYPNPTSEAFTVESEGAGFTNLTLTDVLGRQLRSINVGKAVQKYVLPTSGLATGVYILRVDGAATRVVVR
ncbi:MAG: T9SS type A sorting domain-containing protein [Saprospiraceae bacterium]|nr:T9SS type A sorting domain-containing protein [Saprospiraceae bacterium]